MKKGITILVMCLLSASVFAASYDDNNPAKKKKARKAAKAEKVGKVNKGVALFTISEDEPSDLLSMGIASDKTTDEMTVKAFNQKGELLIEKKMQIEDILVKKSMTTELPQNSVFVMFYGGTAYYFVDKEK